MNLNFSVTLDETNIILAALGKLPYEAAAPVIDKLRQQAQPQLQQAQEQQGAGTPQD